MSSRRHDDVNNHQSFVDMPPSVDVVFIVNGIANHEKAPTAQMDAAAERSRSREGCIHIRGQFRLVASAVTRIWRLPWRTRRDSGGTKARIRRLMRGLTYPTVEWVRHISPLSVY
jgi:hypothetical protein